MKAETVPDSFTSFWDSASHTESPCLALILGEVQFDMPCFFLILTGDLPFPEQKWRCRFRKVGTEMGRRVLEERRDGKQPGM